MKKLILLSVITTFGVVVLLNSCKKEDNEVGEEVEKVITFDENNTKINYLGRIVNNRLMFSINIKDSETGVLISESFDLSINRIELSNEIPIQITEKQRDLSNKLSLLEIERIVSTMDMLVNSKVVTSMKEKELRDLKTQGLFMCNSLVKSIHRKILKDSNMQKSETPNTYVSNTVYEGFNRELSSFALTEDLIISVSDIKSEIDKDVEYSKQKGFLFVKEILNNIDESNISLYELEEKIVEYTLNNPNDFEGEPSVLGLRWPKGSDYGCCGNYSGPCYYWHTVCFAHDVMCSKCKPRWFCFSGCVPD